MRTLGPTLGSALACARRPALFCVGHATTARLAVPRRRHIDHSRPSAATDDLDLNPAFNAECVAADTDAETYTAHAIAIPAVRSNEVYPTP